MKKILIVDDEKGILELLEVVFVNLGYEVFKALNANKAISIFDAQDVDVVLTDIRLPQKSGLDILSHITKASPEIPVIMMTAYGTIKQAVDALKKGAVDYILKPFDIDELQIIVEKSLEKKNLQVENVRLKKELNKTYDFGNIIGKCSQMQVIFSLIEKIAPTQSTILITGESGTGKEMVAKAIHYRSLRRDKPFVSINCGALPENLLESELFGHVKGAFTDAVVNKKGMFVAAEQGSLMLDEIGEMSPLTQVKFLRALQEKSIRQVGGTQEIKVDVRLISATNQNLKKKIAEGSFREDLYYRLNVITVNLPPLRERKGDIPLLVNHFLKEYCEKMEKEIKRITPEVMNVFESYSWPGNIRELENTIERIVTIEERRIITKDCLSQEFFENSENPEKNYSINPGFNLNETLDDISQQYVREAIKESKGNLRKTAELLGIQYRSLRYLVEKYGFKSKEGNSQNRRKSDNKLYP